MSKEIEKKGLGWFKGNRATSETNEAWENIITEKEASASIVDIEENSSEMEAQAEPGTKNVFSKDNQDKVSLDLIVAVENMLKDRELFKIKQSELSSRLQEANETISRYKHDLEKRDLLIQEKNNEIHSLETSLSSKQMSYDQLLEDYKDFQQKSTTEYESLSNQLETSLDKYTKLNEEFTNSKYEHTRIVSELEEKIRSMEIDNKNYASQYEQILAEKKELMQTINEFTERMSFSFAPKTAVTNTEDKA